MVRLMGIVLPDAKRVEYALSLIYGIGFATASKIIDQAGISSDKKVNQLNEEELKRLITIIEKNYKVEGDLREQIAANIKRLKETGSFRGIRHIKNLPVRGQRTRSNARTKRGKRKTVGALKKEDWAKVDQQKQPSATPVKK